MDQEDNILKPTIQVYCDGNQGGVGCTACKQDWYSTNCTKFCQPYNNFTCDSNGENSFKNGNNTPSDLI